jgi:hypothetical protein
MMKKIFSLIALLALCAPSLALAQKPVVTTKVTVKKGSAPSNPDAGFSTIYIDNSGIVRTLQSDGTDTPVGGGADYSDFPLIAAPAAPAAGSYRFFLDSTELSFGFIKPDATQYLIPGVLIDDVNNGGFAVYNNGWQAVQGPGIGTANKYYRGRGTGSPGPLTLEYGTIDSADIPDISATYATLTGVQTFSSGIKTFTAAPIFRQDGIGVTQTDGFTLENATPATALITVQEPPAIGLYGHVWSTASGGSDHTSASRIVYIPSTGATPAGALKFQTNLNGGGWATQLSVDSAGAGIFTGSITATSVTAGASNVIAWTGRGGIRASADGVFLLSNAANTDVGRVQLGGTTSSFPALKRSATAIQFRLADDSGFTDASLAQAIFNGSSSGTLTLKAPAAVTSWTFTPPAAAPASNDQVMLVDTDGTSTFGSVATSSGTATIFDSDKVPTSASSADDELETDISGFTNVNWIANTTSYNVNSTSPNALWFRRNTTASNFYAFLVKAIPGGFSDWVAYVKLRTLKLRPTQYQGAGIVIGNGNTAGAGSQAFIFLGYTSSHRLQIDLLTNYSTFGSTNAAVTISSGLPTCISVKKVGAVYYYGVSYDCENFSDAVFTPGFTPTHIGLGTYNENSGVTYEGAFEWIRVFSDPDAKPGGKRTILLQ